MPPMYRRGHPRDAALGMARAHGSDAARGHARHDGHQPAAPRRPLDRRAPGAAPRRRSARRRPRLRRQRRHRARAAPSGWRECGPTSRCSGLEIDPAERVADAQLPSATRTRRRLRALGGFEVPLPDGRGPRSSGRSTCCGSTTRPRCRRLGARWRRACSPAACSSRAPATRSAGSRAGSRSMPRGPRTLHDRRCACAGLERAVDRRRAAAEGADPPQRAGRARPRPARDARPGVGACQPPLSPSTGRRQRWIACRRGAARTRAGRCDGGRSGGGSASSRCAWAAVAPTLSRAPRANPPGQPRRDGAEPGQAGHVRLRLPRPAGTMTALRGGHVGVGRVHGQGRRLGHATA